VPEGLANRVLSADAVRGVTTMPLNSDPRQAALMVDVWSTNRKLARNRLVATVAFRGRKGKMHLFRARK